MKFTLPAKACYTIAMNCPDCQRQFSISTDLPEPEYVEKIEAEYARLREALERIEAGKSCRAHQCDCESSPEPEGIARAALSEGGKE